MLLLLLELMRDIIYGWVAWRRELKKNNGMRLDLEGTGQA